MADTRRALHQIPDDLDFDLVETLLTSRSDAEAVLAYGVLREILPARALLMLANLREIIALLPESPFTSGTGLDALERAGAYEPTGRSYRRLFESDHGVFGLEFIGEGTLCEGIVAHTATSRYALTGDAHATIDHQMLLVFVSHDVLLDAILEGLQILGHVLEPPIYVTIDDFPNEHGTAAAVQAFDDLF
ncbi:MAG: hypothetical protein U1E26_00580 [Coriobacteriia bacterium]|nr:hypothetical protein [Coriobacteriia bacterium]